jgi:hypothetical protein
MVALAEQTALSVILLPMAEIMAVAVELMTMTMLELAGMERRALYGLFGVAGELTHRRTLGMCK